MLPVISHQESIGRRFLLIFILIPLLMLVGFYITFSMSNTITKEYNQTIQTSIALSQLSMEINQVNSLIENYVQSKDEEVLEVYRTAETHIDDILNNIRADIAKDATSSIFYRNLENMVEYQQRLVTEILQYNTFNLELYQQLGELRTLTMYMGNHSQLLTTNYLSFTDQAYGELVNDYKRIENNVYTVIFIFIMMSFLFAWAFSNDILKHINSLSKLSEKLSKGQWEVEDMKESQYVELNNMTIAFNNMKNNIRYYIEEMARKVELERSLNQERLNSLEKDRLLKESQLLALQNQMNPHFLFNTLNIIGRIALFERARDTVRLIEATAKILRYNLYHGKERVPLAEEVEILKSYVFIQQVRFQDQMSFTLSVEPGLDHIEIPPMTLQPIVENAIIHGLKDKETGGQVSVSISSGDNTLYIKISDNGVGMGGQQLKDIFREQSIHQGKGDTTGLGLANVKRRLELHFGQENLIQIQSKIAQGTLVTITIPLKAGEENA
ncbi:sensor histidine kinase [Alkaliphilus crotonatoxidans]